LIGPEDQPKKVKPPTKGSVQPRSRGGIGMSDKVQEALGRFEDLHKILWEDLLRDLLGRRRTGERK
jgi:hypothetical protein